MTVTLSYRKTTRILLTLVAGLVLAHLAGRYSALHLGHDTLHGLVPLFDLDHEQNIPTFYSAAAILLTSALAAITAGTRWRTPGTGRLFWGALAAILLVMAFDEACQLHERLTPLGRDLLGLPHDAYFAWTLPMGIVVLAIGLAFARFVLRLARPIRNLIVLAAAVFLTGAMGMEILGGVMDRDPGNVARVLVITLEETLEMLGIVLLIRALLLNLEDQGTRLEFGAAAGEG
jgi:hypothetical protein